MRIKLILAVLLPAIILSSPVFADDMGDMASEHDGNIFHMFRAEADFGGNGDGTVASWDVRGWVGGDDNKLWVRSEGEQSGDKFKQAEFWALYSRNISTFWDAQAGIRYDADPVSTPYLTLGFNGLAPYFFDTEAHLFVSDRGDVSARLREENDFLITQKLILQPYAEINLYAQAVPRKEIGAGLADGKIGLQTRYEFTRKFAPYLDIRYGRKFGETSSIAKSNGNEIDELVGAIGLRLMF